MASRGHEAHEFLLRVASQIEELADAGDRREKMRASVRHRLVQLE